MTRLSISFLAGTPFSFYPGRFQMLAIELAARGHEVSYFSQPNSLRVRAERYRQRARFHRTTTGKIDDPRSYRPEARVHEHELLLPLPFARYQPIERANARLLGAQVDVALRLAPKPRVAVVFMPEWLVRLGRDRFDGIVYDVPDDLRLMTTLESPLAEQAHLASIAAADVVTVTANPTLHAALQPLVGTTPLVELGNGVDFPFFRSHSAADIQAILPTITGPTVGFVGAIHHWVDIALLCEVARRLPQVRFALVGNLDATSTAAVAAQGAPVNLLLLGRQPKGLVPALVARFDVALIPFHAGEIADTTDPIKVYEYFAMGRPVVATPMPSLQAFAQQGLLRLASGASEFAAAIEQTLANPGDSDQRIALASQASWAARAVEMENVLLSALARHQRPRH